MADGSAPENPAEDPRDDRPEVPDALPAEPFEIEEPPAASGAGAPPATHGLPDRSPDIEYPTAWDYKVIGEDEERLRAAIGEVLATVAAGASSMLTLGQRSKKGRYLSLQLTVEVTSEAHRHGIFEALRLHEDVRFVL